MFGAWMVGFVVVIATHAIWFWFLVDKDIPTPEHVVFVESFRIIIFGGPAIGAFVVACLAPKHKWILGLSIAIPSALFAAGVNFGQWVFTGVSDFPGLHGAWIVFGLFFTIDFILCLIATTIGFYITAKDDE
jgi:hypothetical protein